MEFRWSAQEDAFRKEVRQFVNETLPPDWGPGTEDSEWSSEEGWQFALDCIRKLAANKWLVMAWPKEYGGLGASHWEQLIFSEEMAYSYFPGLGVMSIGTSTAGPSIMIHGSEEHKRKYLNLVGSAQAIFCQLFTEPGAGSDLASLQTRAVRDGDDYVINGQKIFTSRAHRADLGWMGVRTDPNAPKHRGISTLIVDMKSPGITVRPLITMNGVHYTNEVFFDNVRVPRENLVGVENRGWYQMATTLDFERSGAGRYAQSRRDLEGLVSYAVETLHNGHTLAKEPRVRSKLADLAIELEVGRWIGYRIVWMQSQGMIPNREASMSKIFGAEHAQRLANGGMNLLGLYGQLRRGSKFAPIAGRVERSYLGTVVGTIAGGSSEVNRNIVATRGLGLPR